MHPPLLVLHAKRISLSLVVWGDVTPAWNNSQPKHYEIQLNIHSHALEGNSEKAKFKWHRFLSQFWISEIAGAEFCQIESSAKSQDNKELRVFTGNN